MYITLSLIEQFCEHLKQNGAAKNTVSEHTRQVRRLYEFAASRELSPELLCEYRKHIETKFNTPMSRNANLSAVNALLRFIGRKELSLPLYDTDARKCQNSPRYILTKGEYDKLLEVVKKNKMQSAELILRLIAQTGVRASEVGEITIDAINTGYIKLKNNNSTRKVVFDIKLLICMKKYAAKNNILSGTLFLTKHGKPIGRDTVWRILHKTSLLAGIDARKVTASSLRVFYAKNHLEQSKDIWALSEKLGYAGVSRKFDYPVSSEYDRINGLNLLYGYSSFEN